MDLSLNLKGMISQRRSPLQDGMPCRGRDHAEHAADLGHDLQGRRSEIKEIGRRARNLGMQTFDQALSDLFENKSIITPIRRRLRNADSTNDLRAIGTQQPARQVAGPAGRAQRPGPIAARGIPGRMNPKTREATAPRTVASSAWA